MMRTPILIRDASKTTVYIGQLDLYFSYDTCIAFRSPRMFATQRNRWGSTTGKAINLAIRENETHKGVRHSECEEEDFLAKLEAEMREGIV